MQRLLALSTLLLSPLSIRHFTPGKGDLKSIQGPLINADFD